MNKLQLNLELYKKIYLIRKTEEAIIAEYDKDEMKTPMHMSMGSEHIAAGVCQALGKKNQVFGTYRSHALYLAKTEDLDGFLGEMYGKITGIIKGKGGSMHLISPQNNLLGVSAIVASTIPLAVGAAFANKFKKTGQITAVFFGDGAVDEGVFWESINIACLKKLPVIFICEDNDLAVHTSTKLRRGYKSLTKIVSEYNCQVLEDDSTDPESIHDLTLKAMEIVQKKEIPVFIQLKYYRYLEHVGVYEDFKAGYRDKSDFEKWFDIDPIKLQREKLLKSGINNEQLKKLELQINQLILTSINNTKKASFPTKNNLFENIFYEPN